MDIEDFDPALCCWYHQPISVDDEGYAICGRCWSSYLASPSLAQDMLAFTDHVLRQAGCMTLTERRLAAELERRECPEPTVTYPREPS